MEKPDISSLSYTELEELKKDIDKQKKTVELENRKKAMAEMKRVAEKYGYTLKDLFGAGVKAPRKAAAPKYRNPSNASETWTGRGKAPAWLVRHEAAGGKREDCLIK